MDGTSTTSRTQPNGTRYLAVPISTLLNTTATTMPYLAGAVARFNRAGTVITTQGSIQDSARCFLFLCSFRVLILHAHLVVTMAPAEVTQMVRTIKTERLEMYMKSEAT